MEYQYLDDFKAPGLILSRHSHTGMMLSGCDVLGASVGPNSKFGPNTEYRICSGFENEPNTNTE